MNSSEAIKIVSRFFPSWSQLKSDEVNLQKITGGLMNTVYLIEVPLSRCLSPNVPNQIIIRLFGGGCLYDPAIDERRNSPTEENIICYQTSNLGIGPKMYGIFKDYRIEEYVKSQTLKPKDCLDPQIRKQLAQTYAKFHSLEIPLAEDKFTNYIAYAKHLYNDQFKTREQRKSIIPIDQVENEIWKKIVDFDYLGELDWLLNVLNKVNSRKVLLLNDDNYLNLLVRDEDVQGKSKIAIIDYEWALNGPRCIDLGSLFVNQMIDWSKGFNETGYEMLNEDERYHFISEYLSTLNELNCYSDFDPNELDSSTHVLEESNLGILLYLILFSSLLLQFTSNDIKFSLGPKVFLSTYIKQKKMCLLKYPNW